MLARLCGYLFPLQHLGKYFKQSAKALEQKVNREARFYGALIRFVHLLITFFIIIILYVSSVSVNKKL